jgi:hypothetical protein
MMEEWKFRIVAMVDLVQEVLQETLGMVRDLVTMRGSGTTQDLLSKGRNQLQQGTPTQGMQYGATIVMNKVI